MTKESIIRALVERRFLKKTIAWFDKQIAKISIMMMTRMVSVVNNNIVFITSRGAYDCNPKWITEEIIRQKLPYKLTWVVRKKSSIREFPDNINLVNRGSYEFYKAIAQAKVIIDNSVNMAYMEYRKKHNQILIETWHGAIGIKKFSADTNNDKLWIKKARQEGKSTDYCISNSTFEDAIFQESFWSKAEILQYGHARNDVLFGNDEKKNNRIRKKIFERYDLPQNVKICMYAPTFRDDGDLTPYLLDYNEIVDALSTKFGGRWIIFVRFHFKVMKSIPHNLLPDSVINVSEYPDIQELMTCVDVGITDYSSWICEYLLTRRPGFLFATDMDHYAEKEREFFYPLDSMPFPLATNNEQLVDNIKKFDKERFAVECEQFLRDKGCIDDGHASERIVEKIKEIIGEGVER